MVALSVPLLLLAFSCLPQPSLANAVVVTGNPHVMLPTEACPDTSPRCARLLFINPSHVIAAPAALQADTFSHVQRVQYLDTVVPVCVLPPAIDIPLSPAYFCIPIIPN